MFVKILLLAFVGSVICNVAPDYYVSSFNKYPSSAHYEFSCLSQGGICMEAQECPEGKQSPIRGLCTYKGNGAVCCHSLPKSATRCQQRGGECKPKTDRCPDNLTFKEATDCTKQEKCCILVN